MNTYYILKKINYKTLKEKMTFTSIVLHQMMMRILDLEISLLKALEIKSMLLMMEF